MNWGDYIKRTKAGELTAGTYGGRAITAIRITSYRHYSARQISATVTMLALLTLS